jgi:hypothetical protein
VNDLPYNADELRAMANLSEGDLTKAAAALSIQDVMNRRK